MRSPVPTALVAAIGLIGGYAIAVATGSRPLGGLFLAVCAAVCVAVWLRRHGWRMTVYLTLGGLGAFVLSHALGLLIGAWPAVLLTAALTAAAYWTLSDGRGSAVRAPTVAPPRA